MHPSLLSLVSGRCYRPLLIPIVRTVRNALLCSLTTYGYRYTTVAMKRTTIWLDEDHQKKLKTLSEKTAAPVSALIRKAIEEYLKKK